VDQVSDFKLHGCGLRLIYLSSTRVVHEATTESGHTIIAPSSTSSQIIQIGTGDDKQFIEVPEGYTLIQTPEGLVMSQVSAAERLACARLIFLTPSGRHSCHSDLHRRC